MCTCVCVEGGRHACHPMHTEIRRQRWESILSTMWDPGSNSGHLAWRQVLLPADLSRWSWVVLLDVVFPMSREPIQNRFNQRNDSGCRQQHRYMAMLLEVSQMTPFLTNETHLTHGKKVGGGGNPPHHIGVDPNFLSVEYLTCHLHSCLSRINPRVLWFEDQGKKKKNHPAS